jgi:arginase family enzyme
MKDLGIYFKKVDKPSVAFGPNQIGSKILGNFKSFESPEKGSIAFFSVPEYRNCASVTCDPAALDQVRHELYALYTGDWHAKIYDLGTILPGNTVEDTHTAVRDVIETLVKNDIFPILLGGGQDLMLPIYRAYQSLEQAVNILDIDCALDMGLPDEPLTEKAWLSKIITDKPSCLFNYSLFGYQSYLTDIKEIKLVSDMLFDSYRLGEFVSDERMIEPIVRNSDVLSFDMDAVRRADYLANSRHLPHGLYGEEACRIMRYAGLSDKLTTAGIFNYSGNSDDSSSPKLVSQMIWYLLEGYNLRKGDYPVGNKKNYTRYTVTIDNFKDEIVFYKSDKSNRWWMEVPYPKIQGSKFHRHMLVPCNYNDYENALKNEMPNLWWKTFEKLS